MIYEIIEELRASNSSIYKKEVLERHIDNNLWKDVLFYTYNTNFNYYLYKIPNKYESNTLMSLDEVFDVLNLLKSGEVRGNKGIELLTTTLSMLSDRDSKVFELIMGRDIKSGINAKSINKVYKGLIPETHYQRCSKLDEKTIKNISYPGILQKKADGLFSYGFKHKGNIYFSTRNGTIFECDSIKESMIDMPDNIVIMGEFILRKDGKDIDRKTGNGLINSYIKRFDTMVKLEESNKNKDILVKSLEEWDYTNKHIIFEVWDTITYTEYNNKSSNEPYGYRLQYLEEEILHNNPSNIKLIETHIVNNIEEAKRLGQKYIDNGYEGAILKDSNSLWKDGTSRDMLKIKSILDADLLCVGIEEGTGKNSGKVGSLLLESKCGLLKTKCGTGLTDKDRDLPFDYYIGKVVEVQYNEVIKSKSKDTSSLFLPVFVEVREKEDYDCLEDLK